MKKLVGLIVIVALLGGVAAGLPYWIGMRTEQVYNDYLDAVDREGRLAVRERSFQRGWLESTGVSVLAATDRPFELQITHRISHGPFPVDRFWERVTRFAPVQATVTSRVVAAYGSGADRIRLAQPLKVDSVVDIDGNVTSRLLLSQSEARLDDGLRVSWESASGSLRYTARSTELQGSMKAPSITVDGPMGRITMSEVVGDYQAGSDSALGGMDIQIERVVMEASEGDEQDVTVEGVGFVTTSSQEQGLIDYQVDLAVAKLAVGGDDYGPGKFRLRFGGLDASALRATQQAGRGASPAGTLAAMPLGVLLSAITDGQPVLELSVDVDTPGGKLEGNGTVSLAPTPASPATSPLALLGALRVKASASFPEAVTLKVLERRVRTELDALTAAGKVPEISPAQEQEIVAKAVTSQLDALLSTNKLLADGDHRHQLTMAFEAGELSVNGELTSLPIGY